MAVTNYSDRAWDAPDVEVRLTHHDGRPGTGFIDARRQLDGRWQAFVRYTLDGPDSGGGYSGWFDYEDLELVEPSEPV